jgi:hypothetical protein
MSKSQHSGRDSKKKPLLTPKEKRMAKHDKKHPHDAQPFITPSNTH